MSTSANGSNAGSPLPSTSLLPSQSQPTHWSQHAASASTSALAPRTAIAHPDDPPVGSCPGGGVCNGSGGKDCCQGCPAFNNRIMYLPGGSKSAALISSAEGAGKKVVRKNEGELVEGEQGKEGSVGPMGGAGAASIQGGSDVGIMECHNCGTRKSHVVSS